MFATPRLSKTSVFIFIHLVFVNVLKKYNQVLNKHATHVTINLK